MNIEKKLACEILMMMAGNFDHWQPNAHPEDAREMVHSANLAAQGIAKKLAEGLRRNPRKLTLKIWKKMVKDATRETFLQAGKDGPLLRLGQARGFAEAVAKCT